MAILGFPNTFLVTAVLTYLRHRHVRKEALYNFCCRGLLVSSLLGWVAKALVITKIQGSCPAAWLLWGCSMTCGIGGFLAPRYIIEKRTRAMASTACFFVQCVLNIPVTWHVITIFGDSDFVGVAWHWGWWMQGGFLCALASYSVYIEVQHYRRVQPEARAFAAGLKVELSSLGS